jgi:hypothetical protein
MSYEWLGTCDIEKFAAADVEWSAYDGTGRQSASASASARNTIGLIPWCK